MIIGSVILLPEREHHLVQVLSAMKQFVLKPDYIIITICTNYPRLAAANKTCTISDDAFAILKAFLYDESIFVCDTEVEPSDFKHQLEFLERDTSIRQQLPPIKIHLLDSDPGPVAKLMVPMLYAATTDLIFTFDDDVILWPEALKGLYSYHINCNDSVVFCNSGVSYDRAFIHGEHLTSNCWQSVHVVGGYRGVLYPAKWLLDGRFDKWIQFFLTEFAKVGILMMHDDHLFSYFFDYIGVQKCVVSVHPKTNGLNLQFIETTNGIFQDRQVYEAIQLFYHVHEMFTLNTPTLNTPAETKSSL